MKKDAGREDAETRGATQEGTCRRCGCTAFLGCPGGCCWANAERTLCNLCAFIDEMDPAIARTGLLILAEEQECEYLEGVE
jgi:hypothetical protein